MLYKRKTIKYFISTIIIICFCIPTFVSAASLYFGPSSGTYTVGERFSVRVLVSSTDKKMNAAGADVSFSPEDLELVSISESNSLIDVWGEKPTFDNSAGRISFEGLILDGYQGSAAEIVTLVFRSKKIGETLVHFSSGSVLAYNGLGTSVLKGLDQAIFTIAPKVAPTFDVPAKIPEGFRFTKDLDLTDKELEVVYLQMCLTDEGIYTENITGYFGSLTREAVINFQEKYFEGVFAPDGFMQGTGLVREHTREKLNELCFAPEQLFDISVRLEEATLAEARDLEAIISFESFGRVPTPVDLVYTIVNSGGQTVFRDEGEITVETEEVIRKKFSNIDLLSGSYTLIVKTQYNVDVIDEFRSDFVIEKITEEVQEEDVLCMDVILLIQIIIALTAIIVLLIATSVVCYWRYRVTKRRYTNLMNAQKLKEQVFRDKKQKEALEKEMDHIKKTRIELSKINNRFE